MQVPDLINGTFEALGGITSWMNCWQLYKDKEVKGVVWQFTLFFFTWGVWNLYYYPHLGQWLSFIGGLVICSANLVWVGLAVFYIYFRREK